MILIVVPYLSKMLARVGAIPSSKPFWILDFGFWIRGVGEESGVSCSRSQTWERAEGRASQYCTPPELLNLELPRVGTRFVVSMNMRYGVEYAVWRCGKIEMMQFSQRLFAERSHRVVAASDAKSAYAD
jgi:hypothetical protein